ncbi:MAG: thiolase family protein [Candidatus Heimdallarchaeota archaeon]
MKFKNVYVPYGCYWSTPFVRWQGNFSSLNAIPFAAETALRVFKKWNLATDTCDSLYLGITVPQKHSFYGQTWLAGLIGAPGITGPMIAQACATSARVLFNAASEIEVADQADCAILAVTCDRTSNGPHILYPNPMGPGGKGDAEDWVWDNFGFDPYAKNAMLQTGENVANEAGISREDQDEVTVLRYKQYQAALESEAAFLRRFMVSPIEVKVGRKVLATVQGDEGVFPTTAEGLAKLRPVLKDGTVTFGTQTHPADGNCGMILTTRERAQKLSQNKDFEVKIISFGQSRVKKGFMPLAPVPAAQTALDHAQLAIDDIEAIKMHNPFAVNDVYFSREMGVAPESVNNYGSSLIWGHPQAPTGMRMIIELIEELTLKNGGHGLFTGCAAGDSAAAIVIEVERI